METVLSSRIFIVYDFVPASRAVASSSSKPASQKLHTSAPLCAASEQRRRLRTPEQRQHSDKKRERPHVILGYRTGEEAKWTNCELAKVLITAKEVQAAPIPHTAPEDAETSVPRFLNYGIGEKDKELLFEVLPELTTESKALSVQDSGRKDVLNPHQPIHQVERHKSGIFAAVVDLRNANAGGIAFENRRRIVAAFSRPGKPGDTGLPEVQGTFPLAMMCSLALLVVFVLVAAILTMRVRNVWDHLSRNRKDAMTRRNLRQLIHQRAKVLKYLKKLDRDRYDAVLTRLGLEAESVEGELLV